MAKLHPKPGAISFRKKRSFFANSPGRHFHSRVFVSIRGFHLPPPAVCCPENALPISH
jgi:hypothetical protein